MSGKFNKDLDENIGSNATKTTIVTGKIKVDDFEVANMFSKNADFFAHTYMYIGYNQAT